MLPILKALKPNSGFRILYRTGYFKSRNPKEPHFDRKLMVEVCKPVYFPETVPDHLTCKNNVLEMESEPHPYDVILSKEVQECVNSSKMMLVYHVNSLTNEEKTFIYRSFFKEDLQFYMHNINVLKLVFENTKYQALMKLFESSNALVFSPEISLNKALKLSKKLTDKILLLGGVVEDKLYSSTHLNEINQVFKRNIHGEMVQHLRAPVTGIYRSLNHQMSLLSHYLKEISRNENK